MNTLVDLLEVKARRKWIALKLLICLMRLFLRLG